MDPTELERRASQSLRRLPPPKAPDTFLPRVMVAVRARARGPWYSRAWMTWPRGWQAASAVGAAALVVAVGMSMPSLQQVVVGMSGPWWSGVMAWASARTVDVRVAVETVGVLWRAVVQPVSGYVVVLLALMWAACATFSVALSRVATGEVVES